ncbi:hypothetical protein MNY91_000407 [Campylobacter coli]|nr:hypothetical protein [Campylobacter coli]
MQEKVPAKIQEETKKDEIYVSVKKKKSTIEYEKDLKNLQIELLKFYFSVSKEEQKKRFEKRRIDPLKQYKLSPVDQKSQELWDKYTLAKYSMLLASNTPTCPWTIISSDDKKKARLNLLRFILSKVDYADKKIGDFSKIDQDLVRSGEEEIRKMEANLEKIDNKKADEKIKDLD